MYNEGSNDLDGIIDLVTLIKSSLKKNSDAVTELQKQVNVQQRTIDTLIKRCEPKNCIFSETEALTLEVNDILEAINALNELDTSKQDQLNDLSVDIDDVISSLNTMGEIVNNNTFHIEKELNEIHRRTKKSAHRKFY